MSGITQKKNPTTTARSQRFLTDWTHNVLYDVFAQEFWIIYRHLQSNALATKSPRHPNCSTPHMTSKCHKWQTTILSRNAAFLPLQNMEGVFARWRVKCCHTRCQFFVAIPFRRNWRITGASTIYGNLTCITQFKKKIIETPLWINEWRTLWLSEHALLRAVVTWEPSKNRTVVFILGAITDGKITSLLNFLHGWFGWNSLYCEEMPQSGR